MTLPAATSAPLPNQRSASTWVTGVLIGTTALIAIGIGVSIYHKIRTVPRCSDPEAKTLAIKVVSDAFARDQDKDSDLISTLRIQFGGRFPDEILEPKEIFVSPDGKTRACVAWLSFDDRRGGNTDTGYVMTETASGNFDLEVFTADNVRSRFGSAYHPDAEQRSKSP